MADKKLETFINPPHKKRGIFYLLDFVVFTLVIMCNHDLRAQPRLEVKNTKHNFGMVKRGEVIINKYVIKNAGNEPLVINAVEISCSCTTAQYSKQPLMPGKSDTVFVIFNTATVYGRQDRQVFVQSNDPLGSVRLRYKGIVLNR